MRYRNLVNLAIGLAAVTAVAGCKGDPSGNPTANVNPPLAYIRYFNAVPDTLPLDFRPIDFIEFSQPFLAVPFRAIGLGNYQGYQTGNRKIRVFPNSTDIATVQAFLVDTTLSLTAGRYYSAIHVGFARAGQVPKQGLWVIEDTIPDPAANVAFRVIHAGAGLGNVDLYATATATDPLPATPTFANVAYRTTRAFINRAPGTLVLRGYAAGTTTPVLFTRTAPTGSLATLTGQTHIGGAGLAGSVMTVMIYNSAVAGSLASVTAGAGVNTTPTAVYWIDRAPPGVAP